MAHQVKEEEHMRSTTSHPRRRRTFRGLHGKPEFFNSLDILFGGQVLVIVDERVVTEHKAVTWEDSRTDTSTILAWANLYGVWAAESATGVSGFWATPRPSIVARTAAASIRLYPAVQKVQLLDCSAGSVYRGDSSQATVLVGGGIATLGGELSIVLYTFDTNVYALSSLENVQQGLRRGSLTVNQAVIALSEIEVTGTRPEHARYVQ
jgi:hypothetical protein